MSRKEVEHRQEDKVGFLDFPRDVVAQTRQTAYDAYNKLAVNKVDIVAMNFEGSDYLNSAGIGLIISLVEDASQAGRKVYAYGLSAHYRKLFSMVGLTERLTLVANEDAMREKLNIKPVAEASVATETKPATEAKSATEAKGVTEVKPAVDGKAATKPTTDTKPDTKKPSS